MIQSEKKNQRQKKLEQSEKTPKITRLCNDTLLAHPPSEQTRTKSIVYFMGTSVCKILKKKAQTLKKNIKINRATNTKQHNRKREREREK